MEIFVVVGGRGDLMLVTFGFTGLWSENIICNLYLLKFVKVCFDQFVSSFTFFHGLRKQKTKNNT